MNSLDTLASRFVVPLAFVLLSSWGPPAASATPVEPVSLCATSQNPVGGVAAPSVSCHNDRAKFQAGFHFKLFAKGGCKFRLFYQGKPDELQDACLNACIEQRKSCESKSGTKKSDCEAQEQECKAANMANASNFQKHVKESCLKYGSSLKKGG